VTKRTENEEKGQFSWLKTQWIRFLREEPFTFFYKETIQEYVPFESVSLVWSKQKKKKCDLPEQVSLGLIEQPCLYEAPLPVTNEKKQNMMELLAYIPPLYHDFYQSLITSNNIEDIGPLEEVINEEGND
jgi:hypothetical protein